MQALEDEFGRTALVEALRLEAAVLRQAAASGATLPEDVSEAIARAVPARLAAGAASLREVINATGVIIHTNLGRAPLSPVAAARVSAVATGYSNLEYDVSAGGRGKRDVHAHRLLARLTTAEAAVIVNNNAAATLITLAALAAGREVVVSRGEMVEIGGGFRIPDVMRQSGAVLREVGTTNRTRANDYAAAITDNTALILRVHPSNFRIEGFVERPSLAELVATGHRLNVPVVEDQGSGYLGTDNATTVLRDEPSVRGSLQDGADLVMFSGDKLLGGPQAGIIAGQERLIHLIRQHPLMRAMRADKMTYAALEATLQEYVAERAANTIPVVRMVEMTVEEIEERARRIVTAIASVGGSLQTSVITGSSTIGGGSAPGSTLPTRLIAVTHQRLSASQIEAALRKNQPAIVARIQHEQVVLDLRTVLTGQDEILERALLELAARLSRG
jgi:L-seryl-tRNA(Ser) seleniumtransferase